MHVPATSSLLCVSAPQRFTNAKSPFIASQFALGASSPTQPYVSREVLSPHGGAHSCTKKLQQTTSVIELAEPLDTAASRDLLAAFGKYRAIEQDVWQEVTDDLARGRLQVSELSSAEMPETFVLHPSTEREGSSDGGQL